MRIITEPPLEILHDGGGVLCATTWRGENIDPGMPYAGFSVCHYSGDEAGHYFHCRRQLARWLGIGENCLIIPRLTHSTNVLTIKKPDTVCDRLSVIHCDLEDNPVVSVERLENVDAVVTDRPGLAVGISTADCAPVLLWDSVHGVIGAAHAGWRGAVAGIVPATVEAMCALGAVPEHISAAIAPCIMAGDFEVGEEVARQFPESCVIRRKGDRPHADLPGLCRLQLHEAGVADVTMPSASTLSNPGRYFSARALGIASGRNFSFVIMRQFSKNSPDF